MITKFSLLSVLFLTLCEGGRAQLPLEGELLPERFAVVKALPERIEEKIYIIPRGLAVKVIDDGVSVTAKCVIACGLKSAIFLRKPESMRPFANIEVRREEHLLAQNGQEIDRVLSGNREYVLLDSIWVTGGPLSRPASVYAVEFSVTLTNDDPTVRYLISKEPRMSKVSMHLHLLFELFEIDRSRQLTGGPVKVEFNAPTE